MELCNYRKVGCIFTVILIFIDHPHYWCANSKRYQEHSSVGPDRWSRWHSRVSPCARQQSNSNPFSYFVPRLTTTADYPRDVPTHAVLPLLHHRRCDSIDPWPHEEASNQPYSNGKFRKAAVMRLGPSRVKDDGVVHLHTDYFYCESPCVPCGWWTVESSKLIIQAVECMRVPRIFIVSSTPPLTLQVSTHPSFPCIPSTLYYITQGSRHRVKVVSLQLWLDLCKRAQEIS